MRRQHRFDFGPEPALFSLAKPKMIVIVGRLIFMSTWRLAFTVLIASGAVATFGQTPTLPGAATPGARTNVSAWGRPANPLSVQPFRPPTSLLPPTLFMPPSGASSRMMPAPLANPRSTIVPPQAAQIAQVAAAPTQPPSFIAWDADLKEYHAKVDDSQAHFTFYLTNVSKEAVSVNSVHTSCGCTVAQLPEQPWKLQPGSSGPINVTVNLAGKSGTVVKSVSVDTTAGVKSLLVKVHIPPAANPAVAGVNMNRMQNMQMAMADRQAVFKGDCAKCHAEPAKGLVGAPLYDKACAICHDAANRATSVPDLKHLNHPTTPEHWRTWIAAGKVGSMMPAFAKNQGGPLEEWQIESLVKYLNAAIPSAPTAASAKPGAKAPTTGSALR